MAAGATHPVFARLLNAPSPAAAVRRFSSQVIYYDKTVRTLMVAPFSERCQPVRSSCERLPLPWRREAAAEQSKGMVMVGRSRERRHELMQACGALVPATIKRSATLAPTEESEIGVKY